ncbi:hypothetical protein QYE76_013196 [Lolium multiflorum]|uniref:CCHC-type domain-containing protein n=1 Tax=Lolium multiflorum TaxID=4521 RepID=A0AAD8X7E2_LOLMU|nr:hypothetical protein QYE76_013196 [Lolium multiflorum]
MFNKTGEPLDADDWLQTMENNLEVAGVETAEKVLFATHYLSGPASLVDKCTCNECGTDDDMGRLQAEVHQVPCAPRTDQEDERRVPRVKQGRMSVVEYRDRFLTHKVRPDETDTNEKRKERFLNGLHDEMQTVLVNIPFTPRHNKSPAQNYRPNYTNNNGGPPKPGVNNNNSHHNNNNPNSNNNNGNNNNTNTGPRTGSNAIPVTPKDKSTVNCYECGVVGHYSNECPKKLAKVVANTAAPAQQQRRFARRRNQNNNNGCLYHMTATEAQEAPQTMPIPRLTVCLHWEAKLMGRGAYTRMEYTCKSYQLGHGGNLMFEKDLKQLVDYLGRPYPEFFGIPLNHPSGGPPRWEVTADLRGKLGAPIWETIWFSITGNTWNDGIAKAMQEAIARLCGQNENKIKNTRFVYYPRHDPMGRPLTMPPHPEMNYYVACLDFLLHKTRKELDNARAGR